MPSYSADEQFEQIQRLSETDLAYLAGLIDADGTVTFQVSSGRRKNGDTAMPVPMVLIVNSDFALIEWLKEVIGYGCAYETKTRPTRADQNEVHWSKVHRFQLTGRPAIALLRRALPYLRIKRERAELAMRMPMRHWHYKHTAAPHHRETAAILLAQMRTQNRRGCQQEAA